MSAIPLHLQRRFEQRWASRFNLSKAPKKAEIKAITNGAPPSAKVIGKPAGANPARLSVLAAQVPDL
jgi:hypothetical protein